MNAPRLFTLTTGLGFAFTLVVSGCHSGARDAAATRRAPAGERPPLMDSAELRPVTPRPTQGDDLPDARPGSTARTDGPAGSSLPSDTRQTVDALTQQAQRTADAMQHVRSKRATPAPAAARGDAPISAPERSRVEWPSPDALRLADQSPPDERDASSAAANGNSAPAVSVPVAPAPLVTPPTGAASSITAPVDPPPAPGPAPVTVADGPKFGAANQSVITSATTAVGDDALTRRLVQHVKDYPRDSAGHLDLQIDRLVRDETVPQYDGPAGLSTLVQEDRELLSAVLDGLSNFRTTLRSDNNLLMSRKVRPLLDLADRLRSQAELTIPTLALCSRVQGFGIYDPMGNTFRAGQENPLILYCEVENFASRQNDNLMWETKLSQEVVLYTESGKPIWREKGDIPADQSRNRRHDFYVFKRINLPRTLSPGQYVLKVTVVDEQAKRVAENRTEVNIMAQ